MSDNAVCTRCNHSNGREDRFCSNCGQALGPTPASAIVDGIWERPDGEFVRRVEPEDARHFLGSRAVRVPEGSIGVILVNGVVDRIVAPGERTALSLFERVTDFFRSGQPRTAFYLVDLRPIPVPFLVTGRPNPDGRATKTRILVTFRMPRGDRAALGLFLDTIVGPRTALGTKDLHDQLRSDIVGIAENVVERLHDTDGAAFTALAETRIRDALTAFIPLRYGLLVDATVAPLISVQSLTFHLGHGNAPTTRSCASCGHELPAALRFCDRCGARQPTFATASISPDATTPLFTHDGEQVELDLVIRVQGQHDDFAPHRLLPALVGSASAHLATVTWSDLASGNGFGATEQVLSDAIAAPLQAFGLNLVDLAVIDARPRHGQWLLSARADLKRANDDAALARAYLESREAELDLEALTLAQTLRQQKVRRDHDLAAAFTRDAATIADRRRREGLLAEAGAIELEAVRRTEALRREKEQILRETMRLEQAEARDDTRIAAAFTRELERDTVEHQTTIEADRRRSQLESDIAAKKAHIDLQAYEESRQLEKLKGMAELDRAIADEEHRRILEKRKQLQDLDPEAMIALQAAELAASGRGDAWAEALGARARAEVDREQRAEMARVQMAAMEAMSRVAASRAEAAPVVAAPTVQVQHGDPAATRTCKACAATIRADATFCGACGADQT